jgi:phage terminase large subunit-like protein
VTWDLSCLDWEERLLAGRSLMPENLPLNLGEADRAVSIFNRLRLPDVPGRPALAEAGGDWFRDIVRAMFGSYDPATNTRAIREAFVLAPKKSNETSYSAAFIITALLMNRRPRVEFVILALTQKIS